MFEVITFPFQFMEKSWTFYKKLHKWPGLIISFILLYYAVTGIFMNHRALFSGIDIDRHVLPGNYEFQNWNNAALKGNLVICPDSVLVYGNIGIWLTDSSFTRYSSFNSGLPNGSDNRKIFDVHRAKDGELYAATLFGLYAFDNIATQWKRFGLPDDNGRFTGIESIGDTLYIINRSHLFKGKSKGRNTVFEKIQLPSPDGYAKKVGLFNTIWQIHSGEIFGLPGKLFVDFLGIITAFLSITGIIHFFFPDWIKRRFQRNRTSARLITLNKWSLKWHNKIGAWIFVFLIILFFTGMFLRPPLLIAIAKAEIVPIKYSHLDQPNPWYDKLRDILYDSDRDILLLSTSEGMYYAETNNLNPIHFVHQPPVSVMGINTFQPFKNGAFLIGSFSGLFIWHPEYPEIYNYATGGLYLELSTGRPVGDYKITGTITGYNGNLYMVDYDKGVVPDYHKNVFPKMPANVIEESKMSIWNVCLEIDAGRFFQNIMGNFYILIVPLTSITAIIVVISGYFLWRKKYRTKDIK
jgi:hypothetical protein